MDTEKILLKILDYSTSPGPRYCSQGDDSGEDFYHKVLNKKFAEAYKQNKKLIVDLDGPDGYASSFLDEAFGNLVFDFSIKNVIEKVIIKSEEEPEWLDMLTKDTYIEWEKRRKDGNNPKVTKDHTAWYRINNDNLELKVWITLSSGK